LFFGLGLLNCASDFAEVARKTAMVSAWLVGDPLLSPDRILTTICSVSWRNLSGIGRLPSLDFRFQNRWNTLRCQPIGVAGLTTMRGKFPGKEALDQYFRS
jgi:hypothetical protein